MATDDDRFCPLCDVVLDLHDGPDTCAQANAKAELLERFGGIANGRFGSIANGY